MKKFIYISLICLLIVACKEKPVHVEGKVIDATEISNDRFSLTGIINSSYFIPLETNDECLIKQIDKVVFDNDKIFVLDCQGNKKILVFDRQGKFIYTVGKTGQGPGEYSEISDFCLDTQNKTIYLLCGRNKIIQYDCYNGDFIGKKQLDFYASKIEYSNNRFYFTGDQPDFFNLVVTDIDLKIIDKSFPDADVGANTRILRHPLQKSGSSVYYFRHLDNHIYEIQNGSKASAQYRMDFGKTEIDFSRIKQYTNSAMKDRLSVSRGRIKYWIQNSGYFICYYFEQKAPVMNIYDKEQGISRNFYLKNIDNQYNVAMCLFEYLTDADELVAVVQPADLLENVESIENEDDKNCIKNMKLDEEMNPLLYVVKTK
jgi:hypothetical protein